MEHPRSFPNPANDDLPVVAGVSVVIPAYQSARFILRTLESVFAQQSAEEGGGIVDVIVVDDGSTDGTAALLRPLARAQRITLLRQENRGMAAARNRGLAAARGDLVAFLDHDERWPTDKLAWQSAVLRATPDAVLVAGVSVLVDDADNVVGTYGGGSEDVTPAELFCRNPIGGPSAALIRTSAVRAAGGFDEAIFGADDWDLYLRLLRHGRLLRRPSTGAFNLQHAGQASRNVARMAAASAQVLRKNLSALDADTRAALIPAATDAYRATYAWALRGDARRRWACGDRFGAVSTVLRVFDRHPLTPPPSRSPGLSPARVLRAARRRVLAATPAALPPSPWPSSSSPKLHTLLCHRDVLMGVASAKSFNLALGAAARFVHHDDGTLTAADVALLRQHFPGGRVITRAEADAHAAVALRAFPRVQAWRALHPMFLKIVDVALWSEGERIGYADSDILFFRRPSAFAAALRGHAAASSASSAAAASAAPSVFNRDLGDAYCDDANRLRAALSAQLLECGNAGLWAMPKAALSLARLEAWLGHPALADRLAQPATEQTLTVLLGSNAPGGAAHLPRGYDLNDNAIDDDTVCRHYAGHMRRDFGDVGLPHLFGACRFAERWLRFATRAGDG